MKNNIDALWIEIVELGIATEEELQLITCINGYNEETLNSVIYARTGYRSINQLNDMKV
jgi:hypothetical protein